MKTSIALVLAGALCTVAAPSRNRHFQFFGVDESGAEFGAQNLPGTLGTDYTWPNNTAINILMGKGFNIFRIPFLMERMVPNQMTGSIDTTYLSGLKNVVHDITTKGGHAIIDPHNFGRYYGNIISDPADFRTFWHTLASQFASNPNVIFDTNNEYHDMEQSLVFSLNQAAIYGIRGAGAKTQMIFAEGNSYTGAWTWTQVNDNLKDLKDPENRLVFEMHQYLDSDGSGTSDQCVSSTIGQQRVESATQWLIQNNKRGFLGEYAGGANSVCKSAVSGMLAYMAKYPKHWLGACWWGGGPWWGDYIFAFEPPSSTAYPYYLSTLEAAM